jgi:hypothetical protein
MHEEEARDRHGAVLAHGARKQRTHVVRLQEGRQPARAAAREHHLRSLTHTVVGSQHGEQMLQDATAAEEERRVDRMVAGIGPRERRRVTGEGAAVAIGQQHLIPATEEWVARGVAVDHALHRVRRREMLAAAKMTLAACCTRHWRRAPRATLQVDDPLVGVDA